MPAQTGGSGLSRDEWRLLWVEGLSSHKRRQIWGAALRGHALDDPDDAAVAIEFARRHRGHVRTVGVANSIMYLGLLLFLASLYEPPVTRSYWFMAAILIVAMLANPLVALWVSSRLRRTEARNRAVVRSAANQ